MTGRVIGTEIEYGISSPGDSSASPIVTSTRAILAYAEAHSGGLDRRTRWDYEPESPLRDSRGFDLRRYRSTPVIDPNALGAANLILVNGARFYVDHAHPEYSAPETTDARAAVIADRAGDLIMLEAARLAGQGLGATDKEKAEARAKAERAGENPDAAHAGMELKIYRNNVDGKGASYGAHENYQFRRDTDFDAVIAGLTPFFVTRQVYTGSGRVGLGQKGQEAGFQLSQRADYIETEVSLETTLNRGIINTRDEPHADADEWRRLHVIIGDANLSETATFLKLGATSLVLDAIEDGVDFSDLKLREPVDDVRRVSRDLTCTVKLQLDDHVTWMSAIDVQREYLRRVTPYATDDVGREVLARWGEVLDLLADDPLATAHLLDWTAKLKLMEGLRQRAGIGWDHPKLALIDIQYSDIDPARGLYHALVKRGAMETLVTGEEVAHAMAQAPRTTRAYLRGGLLRRFADDVVAASWDSAIVEVDGDELVKLSLSDVRGLGADAVGDVLEDAASMSEVVAGLRDRGLAGLNGT